MNNTTRKNVPMCNPFQNFLKSSTTLSTF